MTVVLVAVKGLVEGCEENTLASLVSQSGVGTNRQKGRRAGRPPGSRSPNVDLDTDGSPPWLSFTRFPHFLLSPWFLLPSLPLPVSFISLCPSFSLCLSFCYPSEAGDEARGWHSKAELGWEIAFTVHAKTHTKSNDWCSWKCLL